jgi:hypothetical protein
MTWNQCAPFVEALKRREYIDANGKTIISAGLVLYMWEAWQDAKVDSDSPSQGVGGVE